MKQTLLIVLTLMPILLFSQYTYDKLKVDFLTSTQEAKAYTYGNLRLYPIRASERFKKEFSALGKYVSLKEAMEKKKVRITEKGNGAEVNELWIENNSMDTIIVLSGEIVKGGKQDRIIEKDQLLEPKSGKTRLKVFCVESGRWSRQVGSNGENFNTHYTVGTMSLRKVVDKEHDQSKVWSKVEEINQKNKTTSNTSTYTAMDNSATFKKTLKEYLDFFSVKLGSDADLIGVVVVSGDKVLGTDMFATSALFKENLDNLLHAYATEAILNGQPITIHTETVKSYMDKLLSNEKLQEQTLKEKGSKFEVSGKKLKLASYD